MMPIYAFLEGDTLGLLLLMNPDETVAELAEKMARASRLRVQAAGTLRLMCNGEILEPRMTLANAKISSLDRVDGVWERSS